MNNVPEQTFSDLYQASLLVLSETEVQAFRLEQASGHRILQEVGQLRRALSLAYVAKDQSEFEQLTEELKVLVVTTRMLLD